MHISQIPIDTICYYTGNHPYYLHGYHFRLGLSHAFATARDLYILSRNKKHLHPKYPTVGFYTLDAESFSLNL
jgi:hypothetical protein